MIPPIHALHTTLHTPYRTTTLLAFQDILRQHPGLFLQHPRRMQRLSAGSRESVWEGSHNTTREKWTTENPHKKSMKRWTTPCSGGWRRTRFHTQQQSRVVFYCFFLFRAGPRHPDTCSPLCLPCAPVDSGTPMALLLSCLPGVSLLVREPGKLKGVCCRREGIGRGARRAMWFEWMSG